MPFVICKKCRKMIFVQENADTAVCATCGPLTFDYPPGGADSGSKMFNPNGPLVVPKGSQPMSPWIRAAGLTMLLALGLIVVTTSIFDKPQIWAIVLFLVAVLASLLLAMIGIVDRSGRRRGASLSLTSAEKKDLAYRWGWKITKGAGLFFAFFFAIGMMLCVGAQAPLFAYFALGGSAFVMSVIVGVVVYLVIVVSRIGFFGVSKIEVSPSTAEFLKSKAITRPIVEPGRDDRVKPSEGQIEAKDSSIVK